MNKRIIGALTLALSLILLAGCARPAQSNALVFATAENGDANNSYTDYLPVWRELEKRTGVKITFDVMPQDQYNAAMQTRLAAGVNLPDIARLPGNDPLAFASQGLIIPLDGLIEQHAPNIKALFEKRPDVKRVLTAPDGHIYALDSIVDARSEVNQVGYGIRKDWLKKLGLEEPDTIADWYAVLTAFKNDDPNGNGEADEIPLICMPAVSSSGNRTYGIYKLATAYGLHLFISEGWHAGEDGIVSYEWIDLKFKDFLTEMNKWYSEGLIDIEFATQGSDQYTAKAIGDTAGSAFSDMTMQYPQWNERMAKTVPDAHWESVLPAAAQDGTRYLERENPTEGIYYAVTKDCKDPAAAVRWLDYMYASDEGQILMCNFGIEGLSYEMADGKPQLTDYILNYERGSGLGLESLGMNGKFPRVLMAEMIQQRFYRYEDEIAQAGKTAQYYLPPFPRVIASAEETSEYASVMADINTLRDEYIMDFITGRKPISEFENYVAKVKEMGIDRAVAIRQAQYGRYANG